MKENKVDTKVPEKQFRAGAISASIWKNRVTGKDGQPAEFMNVTFQRRYKDKDSDEWKTSSSLKAMDLPKAVVVLNKAYEYIIMNNSKDAAMEL
jgi:hypothetical protein